MVMAMRIRTRFDSADAFIAGLCRLFTETTCFVPTRTRREPGEETAFSLRLTDGTPMLRGRCCVLAAWADDAGPYRCAGLELELLRLTPPSVDMLHRILAARGDLTTSDLTAPIDTRPTVQMRPLFPDDEIEGVLDDDSCEPDLVDRTVPVPVPALRAPIQTTLGVGPVAVPTSVPALVPSEPVAKVTAPAAVATPISTLVSGPVVAEAAPTRSTWWQSVTGYWRLFLARLVRRPAPARRPSRERLERIALPALRRMPTSPISRTRR